MDMDKRYDDKKRRLKVGETQSHEKNQNGIYIYSYTDATGKRRKVRSWRLLPKDKAPEGKKWTKSLREMENEIQLQLLQGYSLSDQTLQEAVKSYMDSRKDWRPGTRYGNESMFNKHIKDSAVGHSRLSDLRYSDLKSFYLGILESSPGSVAAVNQLVNPALENAVRDNIIKANPNRGALSDAKKIIKPEKKEKLPMTKDEQARFLEFLDSDPKYADVKVIAVVALGTGLRAGELFGLTWKDIDFKNGVIRVDHQLTICYKNGKQVFRIGDTKSNAGHRSVPLLRDVRETLIAERKRTADTPEIVLDGYSGFIFKNRMGKLITDSSADIRLHAIVNKYNALHPDKMLHPVTMHIFRHTYCSRMCQAITDPKMLQTIMGHSSIAMTMDVYAKYTQEDVSQSVSALDEKVKVL